MAANKGQENHGASGNNHVYRSGGIGGQRGNRGRREHQKMLELWGCDCGGEKTKTPHSDWCSSQAAAWECLAREYQGCTLGVVRQLAPDIIRVEPSVEAREVVEVRLFLDTFDEFGEGPENWSDFNQRELDVGALEHIWIGGKLHWATAI